MAPSRFDASPDTAVITSTYVINDGLPVLLVTHDLDVAGADDWQFNAGDGDFDRAARMVVSLAQALGLDATLADVAGSPPGHAATRSRRQAAWVVKRLDEGSSAGTGE